MDNQPKDHLVSALIRLCERVGGFEVVARETGLSKDNLWQVINGIKLPSGNPRGVGPKLRAAISSTYPDWLTTSEGEMKPSPTASTVKLSGLSIADMAKGMVPVISSVRAGTWGEINDHLAEGAEKFPVREASVGPHTFALRVEGDSMTSDSGHTFPEGTVLIVEPDRAAKAGDYVVAKDVDTQKATFKRLTTDGSRWYLKPLNRDYRPIEIDDPAVRVIGVVVEYWMGGKL